MDSWIRSLVCALASSLFVASTYIAPPPDQGHAGAIFSYNITFFFPMLGLSLIFGLLALRSLLRFTDGMEDDKISHKKVRVMSTARLLLPVLFHLLLLLLLFIRNVVL